MSVARVRVVVRIVVCIIVVLLTGRPLYAVGEARPATVAGAVSDASGAPVSDARVVLLLVGGAPVADTLSNQDGAFVIDGLAAGHYLLLAEGAGFRTARAAVRLDTGETSRVDLTLEIAGISETVTVTPVRGAANEVHETAEFATAATAETLLRRTIGILPLALREEPGVHVQQTSTSQGSLFVRGLTGQQVVTLIDGVRYNNSTFRPGANQYQALIEPFAADRVEIVRGPGGVQYGSDALGGTVNILTRRPLLFGDAFTARGGASAVGGSADRSLGGSAWIAGGWGSWGFLAQASGRRAQDLRTGGGIDSHSVATRLLGLPSTVLGDRLQATGYDQYGGAAKVTHHAGGAGTTTLEYMRGAQSGAQRYDQLNGGAGNLLHRFDPQTLDFAVARYERPGLGFLDTFSATLSLNSQRDDRTFQNINNRTGLLSRITSERNRTTAVGYQGQGTRSIGTRHALSFGAEYYDESIASTRTEASFSAATGGFTDVAGVRARFPNNAAYHTLGVFAHDAVRLSDRVAVAFGTRFSSFRFSQTSEGNPVTASGPTVPSASQRVSDLTFNANAVVALTDALNLTGSVSRGFRAPNLNDFASIGVSGIGFEVTTDEARQLDGRVRHFGADGPGEPLDALQPEESYNFEGGLRLRTKRLSGTFAVFDSEIRNFIERRTLLLPAGAVGTPIGGQPIIRQDSSGAVYTSLSASSVFVRTNAGHVRLRGVEGAISYRLLRDVTLRGNVSTVVGRDMVTGRPPNLENGIPPAHGFAGVEWQQRSGRSWLELYTMFAAAQDRFSDNDLAQARIGGIRTRQEISDFFAVGAAARGLVRNGVLLPTGESLDQVLVRVLGRDLNARLPLYTSNPGYATLNLRGGLRLSEHASLTVIVENVFDRNYRLMGSGIDAAGRNLMVRQTFEF